MRQAEMSVGLKLPLAWHQDAEWHSVLPCDGDTVSLLAAKGFGHVEYSVGGLSDPREGRLLEEQARHCAGLGLGVALHPYLSDREDVAQFGCGGSCRKAISRVLAGAEQAAVITDKPVMLVLHLAGARFDRGRQDLAGFRRSMLERSQHFLSELDGLLQTLGASVCVSIEHQVPRSQKGTW